jgi:hypothetical protein
MNLKFASAAITATFMMQSIAAWAIDWDLDHQFHHHGHGAPAPLLAAGIPAFALLGGVSAVRWVRKKTRRD